MVNAYPLDRWCNQAGRTGSSAALPREGKYYVSCVDTNQAGAYTLYAMPPEAGLSYNLAGCKSRQRLPSSPFVYGGQVYMPAGLEPCLDSCIRSIVVNHVQPVQAPPKPVGPGARTA